MATNNRVPKEDRFLCPGCGSVMANMQECHLVCGNCGLQLDCNDKGWFW
jgi:ribosomal protein S27AE